MNKFLNLTTRSKLFISFALIILLLAAVLAVAYRNIAAMQAAQENLYRRDFADAVDLMDLRSNLNGIRAATLNMMLLPEQSQQEKWHAEIKERSASIGKLLQQLAVRQRDNQQFIGRLQELQALNEDYNRTRNTQTIPLIYAGKIEEARGAVLLGIQYERYKNMRELADTLGDEAENRAQAAVDQSRQNSDQAIRIFAFIGGAALLSAMAMVSFLTRIIANPLKAIAEITGRIASGDFTINAPETRRSDEVGVLAHSFRNMVDEVRKITVEIREGMNILASSSSEILATTTQVASGSAETATAISETTATVEEVKQTVQLSAQKAKSVSETAKQTTQISQSGRQAVEKMIESIDLIREQTAATANSIVKLSEQSQSIGEIILSVNDLAEQSNLLAVNAAIEAAKAGEQGKGFAVVAQEIKSLAEQSKQATAQVRVRLDEIQKATSAAVMATDLSGRAVEAGVKQSDAAGESIRLLVESIGEAAQAALQIAASHQQQMAGIDQVALAMENIRQASAQNLTGTRQAETAAQNLHELGLKLKQLVERYKV